MKRKLPFMKSQAVTGHGILKSVVLNNIVLKKTREMEALTLESLQETIGNSGLSFPLKGDIEAQGKVYAVKIEDRGVPKKRAPGRPHRRYFTEVLEIPQRGEA